MTKAGRQQTSSIGRGSPDQKSIPFTKDRIGSPAAIGWRTLVPYCALLGLIVIFGVAAPNFLTFGNLVNVATQSSVLLLLALGSALVILMGSIDLSVGANASLAGVLAAQAIPGLGPWALLIAIAVGGGVGLLNGALFTIVRIPSFLVTLGTMSLLGGLSLIVTDGVPVAIDDVRFAGLASSRIIYKI